MLAAIAIDNGKTPEQWISGVPETSTKLGDTTSSMPTIMPDQTVMSEHLNRYQRIDEAR
jgi:hypothetical protein